MIPPMQHYYSMKHVSSFTCVVCWRCSECKGGQESNDYSTEKSKGLGKEEGRESAVLYSRPLYQLYGPSHYCVRILCREMKGVREIEKKF